VKSKPLVMAASEPLCVEECTVTDQEFIEWVTSLIALVEGDRAVDPHDMDKDWSNLELLKKRLGISG
jgi:hypothetical protein